MNIEEYDNKLIVVKYGGNAMTSEELKAAVLDDIAELSQGAYVVLVHGGGPDINAMLKKIGKEPEFIDGLRVTDEETIEVALMVLAGKVNKSLVNMLGARGVRSVGLCGIDGGLIQAKLQDERLGYVGEITEINTDLIDDLLAKYYVPVISTLGCDEKGNTYNINADTAAAYIAGALNADYLLMLTDVPGVMKDINDPASLIPELKLSEAAELKDKGIINGGMIPKVDCCITALSKGVKKVSITDGRVPHCIINQLTGEGAGTEFTKG